MNTDSEYSTISQLNGLSIEEFTKAAEVDELCSNAGLKMEIFEKRGFCRLHCVAKKAG